MEPGAPANEQAVQAAASTTFARRKNRGNIRKRGGEDEEEQQQDTTTVVRAVKQQRGDPLAFSTKKDGASAADDALNIYESNRALQSSKDEFVTRVNETETEHDRDARALREKVLAQAKGEGAQDDGTYKGMNNYKDYRQGFRREHTVASEKGTGSHGPLRGSLFVRSLAIIDYKPDLCKDYKETGFCSYGDACKFMHDRGDYKTGADLEREWEAEQKRKLEAMMKGWNPDGEEEEAAEEEDDLPFACYICRNNWEDCSQPVVTRCKHYFCEKCALKHHSKSGKCAVCEQATHGIFNVAQDIIKKMKKQKEKEKAQA